MAQTFNEITKSVVNRFLQNILIIDDRAYQLENNANALNAHEISTIFAKQGKLCTIFAPSSEEDICVCSSLFAKSDTIVLDWFLDLKMGDSANDEDDAEMDEPRGFFTKRLIERIVADAKDEKLKLVLIYTGETDLKSITDDVFKTVTPYGNFTLGDCCVYTSNVLIMVRAKYNSDEQFKHMNELIPKIVKYEELPDFILNEFANFVNGLLPNFALSAISSIRERISKILGVYSSEMDYAYLGHRVLLKNQNEAHHLLIKLFGESISDLISSSNKDMENWIPLWIENRFSASQTIRIGKKEININKTQLKNVLSDGTETYKEKIARLFKGEISGKDAINNSTLLFSTNEEIAKKSNAQFAILTHHKNVFGIILERPILTLGTVVSCKGYYYVCIQQRCDSVRIKEERKFLFLPLSDKDGNIHVVINKDKYLKVQNNSYAIKTIKFKPEKGEDCVYAKQVGEQGKIKNVFESVYGEKYEWILELKELHAQRVVNTYCSELSRVGLDESEWLRTLSNH